MLSQKNDRFQHFHQSGRWQGLPLRVEDAPDGPRFEQVRSMDAVEGSEAIDILMLGVPNNGMMAGQPTNVFLIGDVANQRRSLTLIDAGADDGHDVLSTALSAAGIEPTRIGQIVLTHCHPDHVGGAGAIKELTGATVFAHPLERSQIERFGHGVEVDVWVEDDQEIEGDGFVMRTIFSPGHSPGHSCVFEPISGVLIAGDMISGFGSVGIFPPRGSMSAYIDSLRKLLAIHDASPFALVCPGHGPVIDDAGAKIMEYIEHRLAREEEVLAAVRVGNQTIDNLLPVIYPDVQTHLSFAARSTLQAHLDKLVEDGRLTRSGDTYTAQAGRD